MQNIQNKMKERDVIIKQKKQKVETQKEARKRKEEEKL